MLTGFERGDQELAAEWCYFTSSDQTYICELRNCTIEIDSFHVFTSVYIFLINISVVFLFLFALQPPKVKCIYIYFLHGRSTVLFLCKLVHVEQTCLSNDCCVPHIGWSSQAGETVILQHMHHSPVLLNHHTVTPACCRWTSFQLSTPALWHMMNVAL